MEFKTERLFMRFPKEEDAQDIFRNYTQDPEVTRYLVWEPHTDFQQTHEWIQYCIKTCKDNSGLKYIIYHRADKQAIGMVDFRFDGFQCDFGYVLTKRYWNQGLMTEAVKPILSYVYRMPNIYRIWAAHDVDNEASGCVMKKLGMQYEGILRKAFYHPNISKTPRDGKVYSLVKE